MLSAKRDAKRFLHKVLNASHTMEPSVITVDKNAAYPPAIEALKAQFLICDRMLKALS